MNIHLNRSPRSIRLSLVAIAMLVASTFGFAAGNASAGVLVSQENTGGGGGGKPAQVVDAEQVRADASGNQVMAF